MEFLGPPLQDGQLKKTVRVHLPWPRFALNSLNVSSLYFYVIVLFIYYYFKFILGLNFSF